MVRLLCLLLSLAAFTPQPRAQGTDWSKIEVQAQQLNASTWMLVGAGGNIGLSVGEDAVFVIDDQFAPMAPKIKAAVARITQRPVQFVLNTHFHYDHTGGNEAFGQDGALIVAHHNVRKRMSSEQLIALAGRISRQPPSPKVALPVVTVAGEISFHINGEEVHAFHVPRAHTDGDLIVHFRQGDIVHMGDTFFNGSYPFIDTSSGGSAEGLIAALDRVLAMAGDKTRIIPGHGPLATRADLQAWRDMLAGVIRRIQALRREGQTDAQIIAAKPAAEHDAQYGGGFIKPEQFVVMMLGAIPK
jgi:glyoxylase-like metal-dependent hydrolase (beta-lactamase superfamily II)